MEGIAERLESDGSLVVKRGDETMMLRGEQVLWLREA